MKKKKCIAMLLAGGQGTRLETLTSSIAKPAVSFGSKYRIIDFPLSNCSNSDIDTVGVLTQYQPLILNEYIASGEPWDLDHTYGGTFILPPYQAKQGAGWYKGTANAIYQNISFLNRFDSEHILILSGDHIYRMDYSLMLNAHIEKDADCTIAVIDVEPNEASRFGIMDYDTDSRIVSFEEKPKNPKSNHASMGVYIFKKDVLLKELIEDESDKESSNDFGKNIIPKMLLSGMKMYAYQFNGYWKDVGTVKSLWEANMDLIGSQPALNLYKSKIYSRNEPHPPLYIGKNGSIKNSICTAGCEIFGTVIDSIISEDVVVGENSVIEHSIIMRGTIIGKNVSIRYSIIDEGACVEDGTTVGDGNCSPDLITLIGRGVTIKTGQKIEAGKIIE